MSARKITRISLVVFLLAAAAAGTTVGLKHLNKPQRIVPTTRVTRGDIDVKIHTSGELRAGKTAMLTAPSVGTSLHLIYLAATGTRVKSGDLVADFDPSDQEHNLEMATSDLKEAEQSIAKAKSDAAVQDAQDKVDLLKAQFDVKRAEMDLSKKDLVSAIDAQKNLLALDEARRHLAQLQQDIPYLPRQAIFAKDDNPVVYVRKGSDFAAQKVKITHRSETRVAIEGLAEGTEVALVNPELQAEKASTVASPTVGGGGK